MKSLFTLAIFFSFSAIQAQTLLKDSLVNFFMIKINYTYQFPLADMNDRFGSNSALGLGLGGKVGKNIFIGVDGNFMFGKKVKEADIFDAITTTEKFLIGAGGLFTDYSFSEKGFNLQLKSGKIFAFKKPNVNSGIMALAGAGFLQHKIAIAVDEDDFPALNNEYKRGYDRLTNGFLLSQFLGYFYLDSRRKRINFYGGIEVMEAFTKNRREWNFDEKRKDTSSRKDILIGIRFGWIIPVYLTQTEKFYYY